VVRVLVSLRALRRILRNLSTPLICDRRYVSLLACALHRVDYQSLGHVVPLLLVVLEVPMGSQAAVT
jgi:hypothetical protein